MPHLQAFCLYEFTAMIESEKLLERKLKREVEKLGGYCYKWFSIHITGLPDRICLLPGGRIFFAEIKTTDKDTSPRQKVVHKELIKIGFRVEVIDTSNQIEQILKDYE